MTVGFHRAFDQLADQAAGLETLIDLGVAVVLINGGPARALDGAFGRGLAALKHAPPLRPPRLVLTRGIVGRKSDHGPSEHQSADHADRDD